MDRRMFIKLATGGAGLLAVQQIFMAQVMAAERIAKISKTDAEWKKLLTPAQYDVLRQEGTEAPFTSPLNKEKRDGVYACVACDLPLFPSKFKFDSGLAGRVFTTCCPAMSRPPPTTSWGCRAPNTTARAAAATTATCSMTGQSPPG